MKFLSALILVLAMAINVPAAHAAYEPNPAPPAPSGPAEPTSSTAPATQAKTTSVNVELSRISSIIYSKNFRSARTQLIALNREFPNNADVNNLLGFTSRKLNLNSASAKFYRTALRIDSDHLGALSYQGELFIATKKIARANKNLVKLEKLCGVNCSEYKDLKKALANR